MTTPRRKNSNKNSTSKQEYISLKSRTKNLKLHNERLIKDIILLYESKTSLMWPTGFPLIEVCGYELESVEEFTNTLPGDLTQHYKELRQ